MRITKIRIPAGKSPARPSGRSRVQALVNRSYLRNICFCLVLIWLWPNRAAAQCLSAPAAYASICTGMQGDMSTYNTATLSSQWHGAKSPVAFGTELLPADDNIGLTGLLASDALTKVQTELDDLAKLGVQFVTVAVSFPILYQP